MHLGEYAIMGSYHYRDILGTIAGTINVDSNGRISGEIKDSSAINKNLELIIQGSVHTIMDKQQIMLITQPKIKSYDKSENISNLESTEAYYILIREGVKFDQRVEGKYFGLRYRTPFKLCDEVNISPTKKVINEYLNNLQQGKVEFDLIKI
jgi:hypothetical protein